MYRGDNIPLVAAAIALHSVLRILPAVCGKVRMASLKQLLLLFVVCVIATSTHAYPYLWTNEYSKTCTDAPMRPDGRHGAPAPDRQGYDVSDPQRYPVASCLQTSVVCWLEAAAPIALAAVLVDQDLPSEASGQPYHQEHLSVHLKTGRAA
jgi:hypothetical protein